MIPIGQFFSLKEVKRDLVMCRQFFAGVLDAGKLGVLAAIVLINTGYVSLGGPDSAAYALPGFTGKCPKKGACAASCPFQCHGVADTCTPAKGSVFSPACTGTCGFCGTGNVCSGNSEGGCACHCGTGC